MRYEIVNGLVEVEGVVDDSMEDIAAEDKANEGNKGVPGFWLTAIKANEDLTEEIEINEQDEDALKHLKDIKCSKLDGDQRGFKLEFFFSSNPYFKNSMLSKTYIMFDDDDDETILKKAIGSEIEWFPRKCLTHKVIKKKPKKGLKNAKLITKIKKCSSFFNFFSPPNVPEENDVDFDEDTYEQLEDQEIQDYEAGTIIQYEIIPHAVSWFTGEAKELEDIEGDEDDDDEDDSEEDEEDDDEEGNKEGEEEDDDEDEDEDEEAKKRKRKLQNLVAMMEKLAPEVKKRVEFLRNIQVQYDEFQSKFREERTALEAKYQKLYDPICTMRYEIVNGLVEVEGVVDDYSMEDIVAEDKVNEGNKGVPGFWLTAIKANEDLTEEIEINEQDEDALKHLTDIKCSKLDGEQWAFKLEFFFSPNPYFKNSVLSKTYLMFDDDDEPIPKEVIGSEIEWFPGKCFTHKVIKKMPKKGLKNAKLITKTKICLSFFHFFSSLNIPEENDVDFDEVMDDLNDDHEVGTIIRDKIIPHAVSWFTGEAIELDDIEGDEDDDGDDSEEDEEDDDEEGEEEDDDEDEDEEKEAKKRKLATGLKELRECKQAVVSEGLCLAS